MSGEIHYSRGSSKFDNAPAQIVAMDFDSFEVAVLADRAEAKGLTYVCAPLVKGIHKDRRKYPDEEHWRLRENVHARRFMAFDFDGFLDAEAFISTMDYLTRYRGFGYTTASHKAEAPRARAILKLSRHVSRDEGIFLGERIQAAMLAELGATAIMFDTSVYRGEQPIYTPVTTSETFHFGGGDIDVEAWLASDAADPAAGQVKRSTSKSTADGLLGHLVNHGQPAETPRAVALLQHQLTHISADCGYETYRNVVWAILSTGWSCAEDLAMAWSLSAEHRYDASCFENLISSYEPALVDAPTMGTIHFHAKRGGWNE